jgi:hypothetical protein
MVALDVAGKFVILPRALSRRTLAVMAITAE